MITSPTVLTLLLFSLTQVNAQECTTPGYLLCQPAGSQLGSISSSDFTSDVLWANLQSTANGAILRRDISERLSARQDLHALCCNPDPAVKCLYLTANNIPFCYVSDIVLPYRHVNRLPGFEAWRSK